MDAAWVRTVSHKDRDGEVITDAEETTIAAAPSRTPQRSSATPTEVALSSATTSNVVDEIPAEGVIEDDDDEEEEEGENNNEEEDEDDEEYEYEDDDDAHFSGFLVENLAYGVVTASTTTALEGSSNSDKPATIEEDEQQQEQKPKWREPSKEAVSMSLRAEKETSGGKRRLAQDLYRIMNQDTEVAGFLLHPSKEDSMDQWTIHLFQFDEDSKLAKDMKVLGASSIELEMSFPNQYPFEPPFVRVASPRFRRQTGFVMNGALCMELLTNDGWNPINDIESVIVSIRSLLVVGDGRLEAACNMPESKYNALLEAANARAKEQQLQQTEHDVSSPHKKLKSSNNGDEDTVQPRRTNNTSSQGGSYSVSEAQAAYSHLSDYHKKKGWDTSGWWSRKG